MINALKRTFSIIILFSFILCFTFLGKQVKASDEENVLSDYAIRVGELETTKLMGGVTLYKERVKTTYNGVKTGIYDPNNTKYEYSHNTVQWVELPKSNEVVRVVSWSKGSADGWAASTVKTTAKDFEAKNPGWIVVAAVNGDSFDINGTKEPAKLHVQDGDVYQANLGYTQIGWKYDNTPIVNGATQSTKLRLEVLDANNNVVTYKEVDAVNTTPSESGISVITKDTKDSYDLTGYKVYVGKYDACRISKYTSQVFVKGKIESISTSMQAGSHPLVERDGQDVREFYIVSKDGSLDNLIDVNSYVRLQHSLTGQWEDVDNVLCGFGGAAGGLNAQVLKDGTPLGAGSSDSFQYTTHPRTIVGFKEDGSTVMMVSDGRGKQWDYAQGLSYFQEGELMRLAGCTSAYNLDGGGSSTLIVRNEYGDFDVINRPSDGSERHIGNAILFVMKDPGITFDVQNTTRNDVIFKLNDTVYSNEVSNVKITIDGKTGIMENGIAKVEGLKEDTKYRATIEYTIPAYKNESKLAHASFEVEVRTKAFVMPSFGLTFTDINKTSFKVVKKKTDISDNFSNIIINMNDTEYIMGSAEELLIEDLIENTKYDLVITYDYTEPETGNVYKGSLTRNVTTLAYELPRIEQFTLASASGNRASFDYKYVDPDGVVSEAYIIINEEYIKVTTKMGRETIKNLDLSGTEYEVQFVLRYYVGTFAREIASEKITIGSNAVISNIEYVLNDGIQNEQNPTMYVEGTKTALFDPEREGYKFLGWYLNDELVEKIDANVKGDITLVAKWEYIPKVFTITYNLDGGTNNENNPLTYTEKTKVTLFDAEREGYKFLGWYLDDKLVLEISDEQVGNITLTAHWEKLPEESPKKGCSCKKDLSLIISLTCLLTGLCIVLRKKH